MVRVQIDATPVEISMEAPGKASNKSTIWPCCTTPEHIPKGIFPIPYRSGAWSRVFMTDLYATAKTLKQPKCSSADRQ